MSFAAGCDLPAAVGCLRPRVPAPAACLPCPAPLLPPGSFDANIDRPLKFWQSARWDGQSDSGAYVKEHGGGDLHVALQWLTTLPPIAQHVRKM